MKNSNPGPIVTMLRGFIILNNSRETCDTLQHKPKNHKKEYTILLWFLSLCYKCVIVINIIFGIETNIKIVVTR